MQKQSYSFEFFPSKTAAGSQALAAVSDELAQLKPSFFSVTYGAGGSTQEATVDTVINTQQRTGIPTAAHLSCIGSEKQQIREMLAHYQAHGINRLVALGGDTPSGMRAAGDFRYANELVEFIRAETGDYFQLEVAAYPEKHPQAKNYDEDVINFVNKVKVGANRAITQYFYNADAYFYFMDKLQQHQLDIDVLPGIMPITNYTQVARFSKSIGAEIPRWLSKQMEAYGEDQVAITELATEFMSGMCQRLLAGGAPGLHFYCMNKVEPSKTIWTNLGLSD